MGSKFSWRWAGAAYLTCLCLLAGSRWLIEGASPRYASTYHSQSEACLSVGLLMAAAAASGSGLALRPSGQFFSTAFGVLLVASAPVLAQGVAGQRLSGNFATLAAASIPVVVAVAAPAMGSVVEEFPAALWPGLAGLAGLLLLVPEPSFGSVRPWLGLAMLPLLAGFGAVLINHHGFGHDARQRAPESAGLAAGCVLAGVLFMVASYGFSGSQESWTDSLGAAGLDALLLLLTLQSLRLLGASRWSAQFLLVPFAALAESLLVLRPRLEARAWVGLALLAGGAIRQLTLRPENSLSDGGGAA